MTKPVTGRARSPALVTQEPDKEARKPLPKTEYELWQGRIVAAFDGIARKIKYVLGAGPSEKRALKVFDAFSHAGAAHYADSYHRSLHDYHVACSMQLHDLGKVGEQNVDGHSELVIHGGSRKLTDKSLAQVQECLDKSTIELAYQFLAENRRLPKGFLKRALLPDFIEKLVNEYGLEYDEATQVVSKVARDKELYDDSKIDFERILKVKNALRWYCEQRAGRAAGPAPSSKRSKTGRPPPRRRVDPDRPALTPPTLEAPVASRYQLDAEDKEYIQKVVDNGSSIKVERHDLRNRVKRYLLRNKRALALNSLGIVVSAVFAGLVTGGIGAVTSLLTNLTWYACWTGGTEAIRMCKVIRAMQRAEASADFKLEANALGELGEMDEKKFRTFLKSLRYVCSHDTLTRMFNAYSELEKDAHLRLSMKPTGNELDDLIRFEEGTARYKHRRKNLDQVFSMYDRFVTTATADLQRMDNEWYEHVQGLWDHKFEDMNPDERLKLFNRAANDTRVVNQFYHYPTNKTGWLRHIFPRRRDEKEWLELFGDKSQAEVDAIVDQELPGHHSDAQFNRKLDRVANIFYLVKSGVLTYVNRWLKGGFKSTVSHGFKIGWHGIEAAPNLQISPKLPKPSADGLVLFGIFFLADLFLDRLNSRINKRRLEEIKRGQVGKTSIPFTRIGERNRTGREEIGTLRKLAKSKLPEFADRVLELHDLHKKVMKEIQLQKQLSETNPEASPYEYMDDYEAAVLLLKRQYHEQMVSEMLVGAVGQLHRSIEVKGELLDRRMSDILTAD